MEEHHVLDAVQSTEERRGEIYDAYGEIDRGRRHLLFPGTK